MDERIKIKTAADAIEEASNMSQTRCEHTNLPGTPLGENSTLALLPTINNQIHTDTEKSKDLFYEQFNRTVDLI